MKRILWRDKFRRITEDNGRRYVSVEWDRGENHQAVRADAARTVAAQLGAGWQLGTFVDVQHFRRFDGHPAAYRRYSVIAL